jgi:hypothetical protein
LLVDPRIDKDGSSNEAAVNIDETVNVHVHS